MSDCLINFAQEPSAPVQTFLQQKHRLGRGWQSLSMISNGQLMHRIDASHDRKHIGLPSSCHREARASGLCVLFDKIINRTWCGSFELPKAPSSLLALLLYHDTVDRDVCRYGLRYEYRVQYRLQYIYSSQYKLQQIKCTEYTVSVVNHV